MNPAFKASKLVHQLLTIEKLRPTSFSTVKIELCQYLLLTEC